MESTLTNPQAKPVDDYTHHLCACGRNRLPCDRNDPCPDFIPDPQPLAGPIKIQTVYDLIERLGVLGGEIVRSVDCTATEISAAQQKGDTFIYNNIGYVYKRPSL